MLYCENYLGIKDILVIIYCKTSQVRNKVIVCYKAFKIEKIKSVKTVLERDGEI